MEARDAFYQCLDQSEVEFEASGPVPKSCQRARRAFEGACKPSWVKHFDTLHDKRQRLARTLQTNISRTAASAKGNLAGTPQREP